MDRSLFFIHLSVRGHLSCFYLFAVVNNAAVNVGIQVSVCIPAFNSFGYIPGSGIAGSYGTLMFTFFKNDQTVFHRGCSALVFCSCMKKVLISHLSKQQEFTLFASPK